MNTSAANKTLVSAQTYFYNGITGLLACNVFVSLHANVYIVWQRVYGAGGAVVSELFALNLAVSEIIFCLSSLYVMIQIVLKKTMSTAMLVLQCFIQLMFISRPVFQSCICLERYLAAVHPTTYLRVKPLRYRLLCCVLDWLLVLLYSIVPTFTLSNTQSACLVMSNSLLFLLLMLFCGVRVLFLLRQPGPSDRGGHHRMKRKAFKVIVINLVFTSSTQLLRVFLLGPTLLCASQLILMQIMLVVMAINIISGYITPLLLLHRAGKMPCIKF
ncbi:chemokine XC receptor 1-like [Channa argus]|uniref:chemokine XC receptor 1-like n=1 Tax=Channa argus TaxID=215402 RepID=UPI0035211405